MGSPPREWGQPPIARAIIAEPGFTPTRVGTAPGAHSISRPNAVHPHASGDSSACPLDGGSMQGSPPREWGQPHPSRWPAATQRFTPTRVGTATKNEAAIRMVGVHPHASGDSKPSQWGEFRKVGSPPREWGQPGTPAGSSLCRRFTPTRVGTAPPRPAAAATTAVHPHASGDSPRMAIVSIQHCDYQRPIRRWSA